MNTINVNWKGCLIEHSKVWNSFGVMFSLFLNFRLWMVGEWSAEHTALGMGCGVLKKRGYVASIVKKKQATFKTT